jgi:hypothetical protein
MASLRRLALFQAPCGISSRCFPVQFFRWFLVAGECLIIQLRPLAILSVCQYNWRITTRIFMKFDIGGYQDLLSGQFKFKRQSTILKAALQVFICSESMWTSTLTRKTEQHKVCTESNFLFGTRASELRYDIMVENMAVCISFTVPSAERACTADAAQHTILLIYEPHLFMDERLRVNSWPHICLCRFTNVPN